jgi:hypothetical protein
MGKIESATLTKLRETAQPLVMDVSLPEPVQDAAARVTSATDLLGALRFMGELALVAEDAKERAEVAQKAIRAALLDAMLSCGAPAVRLAHHTVSTASGAAGVRITDVSLIPADLMRQPPAQPDKDAIRARLKAKQPVPGAVLTNGSDYLQFRSAKES